MASLIVNFVGGEEYSGIVANNIPMAEAVIQRRFCRLAMHVPHVCIFCSLMFYGSNIIQRNVPCSSSGMHDSWFHLFNPILVFASFNSLPRCLFLLCCNHSEKGRTFIFGIVMILMILVSPLYVMAVPALIKLMFSAPRHENRKSSVITAAIASLLFVFIVLMITLYYCDNFSSSVIMTYNELLRKSIGKVQRLSVWSIVKQYATQISRRASYVPNASLWWYLEAQMLPEYALYFDVLTRCLPWLCSCLLYWKLADDSPLITTHLTLATATFFKRDCCLADLWFAGALLLSHGRVVARMHNLPWIVAGVAVPSALLPLMLHLWADRGTVNANYLFFQTMCMWLFYALGVVEFVAAHRLMLCEDAPKGGD